VSTGGIAFEKAAAREVAEQLAAKERELQDAKMVETRMQTDHASEISRYTALLAAKHEAVDSAERRAARAEEDAERSDASLRSFLSKHDGMKRKWKHEMQRLEQQLSQVSIDRDRTLRGKDAEIAHSTKLVAQLDEELQATRAEAEERQQRDGRTLNGALQARKQVQGDLGNAEQLLAKSERQRLDYRAKYDATKEEADQFRHLQAQFVDMERALREAQRKAASLTEQITISEAAKTAATDALEEESCRRAALAQVHERQLDDVREQLQAVCTERETLLQGVSKAKIDANTVRAELEHAKSSKELLEKDHALAMGQLEQQLTEDLISKEERLVSERSTAADTQRQERALHEQELNQLKSQMNESVEVAKQETSRQGARQHEIELEQKLAEHESQWEHTLASRLREAELDHKYALAENDSAHQHTMQQHVFDARMAELQSLQQALQDEKDTLFTLEERLQGMVEERVATLKDSLHVTEHETILGAHVAAIEQNHNTAKHHQAMTHEKTLSDAISHAETRKHAEFTEQITELVRLSKHCVYV
jgi:hypothetical protein